MFFIFFDKVKDSLQCCRWLKYATERHRLDSLRQRRQQERASRIHRLDSLQVSMICHSFNSRSARAPDFNFNLYAAELFRGPGYVAQTSIFLLFGTKEICRENPYNLPVY